MIEQMTPMPAGDPLERLLRERGRAFGYPATPDLAMRVQAGIVQQPRARTLWRPPPALGYAALATVLAVVALLAIEPVRTGVAEFFGLVEGHSIERIPATPTPAAPPAAAPGPSPAPEPTVTPTATPEAPISSIADLVRLQEAADALGYEPAVPEGHGPLRAVYLLRRPLEARVVVLEYADFDLWQSRSSDIHVGKGVPEELLIEVVVIRDDLGQGYWIEGGRHFMRFLHPSGETVFGTERAVDRNVLVWRGEQTFYRIETDLPLEEVLAIAELLP